MSTSESTVDGGPVSGKPFSAESYYATQPPPATLDVDVAGVREFVARQAESGRRVVLVTVCSLRTV